VPSPFLAWLLPGEPDPVEECPPWDPVEECPPWDPVEECPPRGLGRFDSEATEGSRDMGPEGTPGDGLLKPS